MTTKSSGNALPGQEVPPERDLGVVPDAPALEDDRPINECCLLLRTFGSAR